MGPKVDAACRFVERGGTRAVITSLANIVGAVSGDFGTVVLHARAARRIQPADIRPDQESTDMPDAIEVRKVPIHSVADASELAKLIDDGVMHADRVIAIIGKTEGNGGVNDYTRIISDRAFREVLVEKGAPAEQVKQIPIVWSGGTDGVISPHATIFATVPPEDVVAVRRAAADRRLRDERGAAPRGHRAGGDGREGRRRDEGRHGARRASPTRPRCTTCRPRRRC